MSTKYNFMIRDIRTQDSEEIINLYYSYYEELNENPGLGLVLYRRKPDFKQESEWFEAAYKQIGRGNSIALVAEADGKAVGLCDVIRIKPGTSADHVGQIGIAVKKEYRSHGIGRALMSEAIRRSKGKFEQLILNVFENNKAAINLYKKLGFREFGTLKMSQKRGNRYFNEKYFYLRLK
ncbi:MAG: GNAT family N-acetyltransferase [Candidatus Micrarchaeaceae archaeon]